MAGGEIPNPFVGEREPPSSPLVTDTDRLAAEQEKSRWYAPLPPLETVYRDVENPFVSPIVTEPVKNVPRGTFAPVPSEPAIGERILTKIEGVLSSPEWREFVDRPLAPFNLPAMTVQLGIQVVRDGKPIGEAAKELWTSIKEISGPPGSSATTAQSKVAEDTFGPGLARQLIGSILTDPLIAPSLVKGAVRLPERLLSVRGLEKAAAKGLGEAARETVEAVPTWRPPVPRRTTVADFDFERRFATLSRRVRQSEKNLPMTDADIRLEETDWRTFSRIRGYTESEIEDFQELLDMVHEGIKKGYSIDDLAGMEREAHIQGGTPTGAVAAPRTPLAAPEAVPNPFVPAPTPKPTPKVILISEDMRPYLAEILNDVESFQAGGKVFRDAGPGMGGSLDVKRFPSDLPDDLRNIGVTKSAWVPALRKALDGHPLTPNQAEIVDRAASIAESRVETYAERGWSPLVPVAAETTEDIPTELPFLKVPEQARLIPGEIPVIWEKAKPAPGTVKPTPKPKQLGLPLRDPNAAIDLFPEKPPTEGTQELRASSLGVNLPGERVQPTSKSFVRSLPLVGEAERSITKKEILNYIETEFDVPIRGRALRRMGRETIAWYERRPELVRLKVWGDLEPLTHEIAHHIDKGLIRELGPFWKSALVEKGKRNALVKELADLDYDQKARRTSEGFAEYIRHRLTLGDETPVAPRFTEAFNRMLGSRPDLARKLEGAKERYDIWRDMGAMDRMKAQIVWRSGSVLNRLLTGARTLATHPMAAWERYQRDWVDVFEPIREAEKKVEKLRIAHGGQPFEPKESAFAMATAWKGTARNTARAWVEEAAIDEFNRVIGPSLQERLKPIPADQLYDWITYGVAKRALQYAKRGFESGFDVKDATYVVEKFASPVWDKALDDVTDWANLLLERLVDAGGLSAESAKAMRELNPVYLMFSRVMEDGAAHMRGSGKGLAVGAGIKRVKGGGQAIYNPLETMTRQAEALIARSHKIRITRAISEWADVEGAGRYIVKTTAPQQATTFTAEKITKDIMTMLEEAGTDVQATELEFDKLLTVFTDSPVYRGKENIVPIWKNGKQQWYEVSKDLFEAVNGMDTPDLGKFMSVLYPFTAMKRLGATGLRAAFGFVKNPWRDFLTYAVQSKRLLANPFEPFAGVVADISAKPGSPAFRFKVSGEISSLSGNERERMTQLFDNLVAANLGAKGRILQIARHPVDATLRVLQFMEMGPRVAEYTKVYDMLRELHPKWTDESLHLAALNAGKDVTTNFSRAGLYGQKVNLVKAFFNSAVQGWSKIGRTLAERPIQTTVKAMAYVSAPYLAAWWNIKDDPDYVNIPESWRFQNMWIRTERGLMRLPIPNEVGLFFAAYPVAIADGIYRGGSEEAKKNLNEMWVALRRQLPVDPLAWRDFLPDAVGPIVDVAVNKDWLDRPIESIGVSRLPVTLREREETTGVARGLSKALNAVGFDLSPIQIDYLIRNYTGGWSRQFEGLGGVGGPADMPVIGELYQRVPARPTRQLEEFYREREDLEQKKAADILTPAEARRLQIVRNVYNLRLKPRLDRLRQPNMRGNAEISARLWTEVKDSLAQGGWK